MRTWHGRLAASGLHHDTVAKIYRLFRSIMTTAADDGRIARNPVRIKDASAELTDERDSRVIDTGASIRIGGTP